MEIQAAEQIEEESIGGDSEVEVLEPLESHSITILCKCPQKVQTSTRDLPVSLSMVCFP